MDLTVVKTFDNYFSANILLTRLQDAGIECWLQDDLTVTIDPILTNAIGGIKLVVKKEDETETSQLFHQYQDEYMQQAVCPKCHSKKFNYIARQSAANFFTAIFTWLFSSYAAVPEYVYQCENCGYEAGSLPEVIDAKS